MRKTVTSVFTAILTTICLAGCASIAPIQQDQTIVLGEGQGLAAVAFNIPDTIRQVYIQPADHKGNKIEINSIAKGESIFLFVVPAGRYCLEQFHTLFFKFEGQGYGEVCFQVPAGKLGYSGELSPTSAFNGVMMHQDYDAATFHALLRSKYPKIAAQFLSAE